MHIFYVVNNFLAFPTVCICVIPWSWAPDLERSPAFASHAFLAAVRVATARPSASVVRFPRFLFHDVFISTTITKELISLIAAWGLKPVHLNDVIFLANNWSSLLKSFKSQIKVDFPFVRCSTFLHLTPTCSADVLLNVTTIEIFIPAVLAMRRSLFTLNA